MPEPATLPLDAELASRLGWRVFLAEDGRWVGYAPGCADTHLPVAVPAYSTSLDAMAAAEEELDRRGLADAYVLALGGGRACPGEVTVAELWRALVTAGAEARARAAVEVLKG